MQCARVPTRPSVELYVYEGKHYARIDGQLYVLVPNVNTPPPLTKNPNPTPPNSQNPNTTPTGVNPNPDIPPAKNSVQKK
jgi:hypothetical protein